MSDIPGKALYEHLIAIGVLPGGLKMTRYEIHLTSEAHKPPIVEIEYYLRDDPTAGPVTKKFELVEVEELEDGA